jgi:hypothetical protein
MFLIYQTTWYHSAEGRVIEAVLNFHLFIVQFRDGTKLQLLVSLQEALLINLSHKLEKGAPGSVVVEALCCKPEGHGIASR